MSGAEVPTHRYCVEFRKGGVARFLSHIDLQAAFERALRRARLPLAYSQGFQPRPKLQFEEALPLGWSSERERMWVEFHTGYPDGEAAKRLRATLPEGVTLLRVYPAPAKPRPATERRFRVVGLSVEGDWGERLAAAFPGAAEDGPAAAELLDEQDGLVFHLRPGRKGQAPSLKKVLRHLLDGDPPVTLEVLRLDLPRSTA